MHNIIISSALDTTYNVRVALKKLARPFQSSIHALRTYRELCYLKHMKHENVCICVQDKRHCWMKFNMVKGS